MTFANSHRDRLCFHRHRLHSDRRFHRHIEEVCSPIDIDQERLERCPVHRRMPPADLGPHHRSGAVGSLDGIDRAVHLSLHRRPRRMLPRRFAGLHLRSELFGNSRNHRRRFGCRHHTVHRWQGFHHRNGVDSFGGSDPGRRTDCLRNPSPRCRG